MSSKATPARASTTRSAVLFGVDTGISIGSWSSVRTPDAATESALSLAGCAAREPLRAGRADGGSFSGGGEGDRSTCGCGCGSGACAPAAAAGSPIPTCVFPAGAGGWFRVTAPLSWAIGALASAAPPAVRASMSG
ncbi:hypothetical protein WME97_20740 [Sorangium sp. So ce367]|uniref:hypothetical protein n=1 Tax=Sorangium sp. So ce367 TaxID=3133305 RepID=UPI003F5E02CD